MTGDAWHNEHNGQGRGQGRSMVCAYFRKSFLICDFNPPELVESISSICLDSCSWAAVLS